MVKLIQFCLVFSLMLSLSLSGEERRSESKEFQQLVECTLDCQRSMPYTKFGDLVRNINVTFTWELEIYKYRSQSDDTDGLRSSLEKLAALEEDLVKLAHACLTNKTLAPSRPQNNTTSSRQGGVTSFFGGSSIHVRPKPAPEKIGSSYSFQDSGKRGEEHPWKFLGEATITSGKKFEAPNFSQDITLGGLSGITYDRENQTFLMASDNSTFGNPEVLFQFKLRQNKTPELVYTGIVPLRTETSRDNFESLVKLPNGDLILTSEAPFSTGSSDTHEIRQLDSEGKFKRVIPLPRHFQYKEKTVHSGHSFKLASTGTYETESHQGQEGTHLGRPISQFPNRVGPYKKEVKKSCYRPYKKRPNLSLLDMARNALSAISFGVISPAPLPPEGPPAPIKCRYEMSYKKDGSFTKATVSQEGNQFTIGKKTDYRWVSGPRPNHGLEAATLDANGLYTIATEGPLAQDELRGQARVSRFLQYNLAGEKPQVISEFLYLRDKGEDGHDFEISEILSESPGQYLVIERYFHPTKRKAFAKIYRATIDPKKSILGAEASSISPILSKELVLNLNDIVDQLPQGHQLDNYEGLSFGPESSTGKPILMIASDNNFNSGQRNSFLLFELP